MALSGAFAMREAEKASSDHDVPIARVRGTATSPWKNLIAA